MKTQPFYVSIQYPKFVKKYLKIDLLLIQYFRK